MLVETDTESAIPDQTWQGIPAQGKVTLGVFLKHLCPQAAQRHLRMFQNWLKDRRRPTRRGKGCVLLRFLLEDTIMHFKRNGNRKHAKYQIQQGVYGQISTPASRWFFLVLILGSEVSMVICRGVSPKYMNVFKGIRQCPVWQPSCEHVTCFWKVPVSGLF